mmetsp:Transcript_53237/g.140875  ORF Transcript_53237/g.140875 Transcript_53237/m.140875 type:complete len:414 (+) Transcript_53237:44-1285(+)
MRSRDGGHDLEEGEAALRAALPAALDELLAACGLQEGEGRVQHLSLVRECGEPLHVGAHGQERPRAELEEERVGAEGVAQRHFEVRRGGHECHLRAALGHELVREVHVAHPAPKRRRALLLHVESSQLLDPRGREGGSHGQRAGPPLLVALIVAQRAVHEGVGVRGVQPECHHLLLGQLGLNRLGVLHEVVQVHAAAPFVPHPVVVRPLARGLVQDVVEPLEHLGALWVRLHQLLHLLHDAVHPLGAALAEQPGRDVHAALQTLGRLHGGAYPQHVRALEQAVLLVHLLVRTARNPVNKLQFSLGQEVRRLQMVLVEDQRRLVLGILVRLQLLLLLLRERVAVLPIEDEDDDRHQGQTTDHASHNEPHVGPFAASLLWLGGHLDRTCAGYGHQVQDAVQGTENIIPRENGLHG